MNDEQSVFNITK